MFKMSLLKLVIHLLVNTAIKQMKMRQEIGLN